MMKEQKKILLQAKEEFNKQNFDKAKILFGEVISINPKNFEALHAIGLILSVKKEFDEAINFFQKSIKLSPNYVSANFNLANALVDSGNYSEAVKYFKKSLNLSPNNYSFYLNYGNCLFKLQKFEEAIIQFKRSVSIKPDFFDAWLNLGISCQRLNKHKDAIKYFDEAVKLNPNFVKAYNLKGVSHNLIEELQKAEENFEISITKDPNFSEPYINLGILYRKQKKYNESIEIYNKALKIINDNAALEILNLNLSNIYLDLNNNEFGKDYSLCKKYASIALELNPENIRALNNIAVSNLFEMNYKSAAEGFEKTIKLDPNYVDAHRNLGVLYNHLGAYEKSERCIKRTLELDPDNISKNMMLAETLLHQNKFSEGWEFYEYRWNEDRTKVKPNFLKPTWEPKMGYGKILIWAEQGIGDQLLFSSILPELTDKFEKVFLLADKRLCKILQESLPKIVVMNMSEPITQDFFDYHLPVCSLARYFRKNISDFKNLSPLLKLPSKSKEKNKLLKVGLSWKSKGGLKSHKKSMVLSDLAKILNIGEIDFYNIQYTDESDEVEYVKDKFGIEVPKPRGLDAFNDLYGLLEFINSCDFIISTSNSNAHLAASLGKITYLLLPKQYGKLWYWDNNLDNNNLWYPSIRKIYQTNEGEWDGAVENLYNKIIYDFF
tara:strand:+ start:2196 stop:4187 length:1992 start_codon:yes stop_codon:yes gene_type:complete